MLEKTTETAERNAGYDMKCKPAAGTGEPFMRHKFVQNLMQFLLKIFHSTVLWRHLFCIKSTGE